MKKDEFDFTPVSTSGNGRGAQMTGARTDISGSSAIPNMSEDRFNEHREPEGIRDPQNEPNYEMQPIHGNGFGLQDPRHPGYHETSVHNSEFFDEEGHKDFNNPLAEELQGSNDNPYREKEAKDGSGGFL